MTTTDRAALVDIITRTRKAIESEYANGIGCCPTCGHSGDDISRLIELASALVKEPEAPVPYFTLPTVAEPDEFEPPTHFHSLDVACPKVGMPGKTSDDPYQVDCRHCVKWLEERCLRRRAGETPGSLALRRSLMMSAVSCSVPAHEVGLSHGQSDSADVL